MGFNPRMLSRTCCAALERQRLQHSAEAAGPAMVLDAPKRWQSPAFSTPEMDWVTNAINSTTFSLIFVRFSLCQGYLSILLKGFVQSSWLCTRSLFLAAAVVDWPYTVACLVFRCIILSVLTLLYWNTDLQVLEVAFVQFLLLCLK